MATSREETQEHCPADGSMPAAAALPHTTFSLLLPCGTFSKRQQTRPRDWICFPWLAHRDRFSYSFAFQHSSKGLCSRCSYSLSLFPSCKSKVSVTQSSPERGPAPPDLFTGAGASTPGSD